MRNCFSIKLLLLLCLGADTAAAFSSTFTRNIRRHSRLHLSQPPDSSSRNNKNKNDGATGSDDAAAAGQRGRFGATSSSSSSSLSDASRRRQEQIMEAESVRGADKISRMCVAERTKRAMLAEAVENRIFQLQEDLDMLLLDNENRDSASEAANSLSSLIPEDEETRSKCVDIAKEIKVAQQQYRELVNGDASDMLAALDSLGSLGKKGDSDDMKQKRQQQRKDDGENNGQFE